MFDQTSGRLKWTTLLTGELPLRLFCLTSGTLGPTCELLRSGQQTGVERRLSEEWEANSHGMLPTHRMHLSQVPHAGSSRTQELRGKERERPQLKKLLGQHNGTQERLSAKGSSKHGSCLWLSETPSRFTCFPFSAKGKQEDAF